MNVSGERERIRSAKGRVFALDDEPHVMRVWLPTQMRPGLAMSRAFGDLILKNYGVTCVPEVSFRWLTEADKFLVLASDGVSFLCWLDSMSVSCKLKTLNP